MRSALRCLFILLTCTGLVAEAFGQNSRVTEGLQALYGFEEGAGTTVTDVSGVGIPLDLAIADPATVSWIPGGGLDLQSASVINSLVPAAKLITAAQSTQALTVEAWVAPANTTQLGPARIFALSVDGYPTGGNFMLGQSVDAMEMRLRTTTTNRYGLPGLISSPGTVTTNLQHVVYTREAGGVTRLYLDGTQNATGTLAGDFSSWDNNCTLTIGNEPPGNRPWLGQVYLMAVYDRALDGAEVGQNFAAGHLLSGGGPVVRYVAETGSDVTGDGSEGNPFGTIQHAIDLSGDADEVRLLPGIFTGDGNRDLDFQGKAILVGSRDEDPATCIINCEGSALDPHRGFIFQNDEGPASELVGLTITGGYSATGGGGILLDGGFIPLQGYYGSASPRVRQCKIITNTNSGVLLNGISNPEFSDCVFNANIGTGLSVADAARGTFDRCSFNGNTGQGFGANSYDTGDINVTDCEFNLNGGNGITLVTTRDAVLTRCTVDGNGGTGIYFGADEGGRLVVEESDIVNNVGAGIDSWDVWSKIEVYDSNLNDNGLHGLRLDAAYSGDNIVQDTEILGNGEWGIVLAVNFSKQPVELPARKIDSTTFVTRCTIGMNDGGGIGGRPEIMDAKTIAISDCLVFDNRGDGISLLADPFDAANITLAVTGSTIAKNDGRGIYVEAENLVMQNTIIANNVLEAVDLLSVPAPQVTCNDVYANLGGDWTGTLASYLGVDGNITQAPLFCNLVGNDFTLFSTSICLEANQPLGAACGQIGSEPEGCVFDGTFYVAVDGDDANPGTIGLPFATIQHAIDVASAGNTIMVGAGTYSGPGNQDIEFRGVDIVVMSNSGDPTNCIVDAGGMIGFWWHGGESTACELNGISVTNAATGILVGDPTLDSGASPTLTNCIVDQCGTGIEIRDEDSAPHVSGCTLTSNGTGIAYLEDAPGGRIDNTRVTGSTGHGVYTTGLWTLSAGAPLAIENCELDNNQGSGLHHSGLFGSVAVTGGSLHDNGQWGAVAESYEAGILYVDDALVYGNDAGGINAEEAWSSQVAGCDVYGNTGSGIVILEFSSVSNNLVHDNTGDGIEFTSIGKMRDRGIAAKRLASVSGCDIYRNGGHGVNVSDIRPFPLTIENCVIFENTGDGVHVTAAFDRGPPPPGPQVVVNNSTITANAAGISVLSDLPVFCNNTIIAFNAGEALVCDSGSVVAVTCSNLFGNLGGDEPSCLPGLIGTDNNISVDPEFCGDDNSADPYTLGENSPCAAENNPDCGQIGARGIGCTLAPVIQTVTDVGGDQGGQVRLTWRRCGNDQAGASVVITGYGVYREQGEFATTTAAAGGRDKLAGWDYIATVPARQDEFYQFVAPTLCDSTITAGLCLSNFMVSAMTDDPGTYFDSVPIAGYSVDNLSPVDPAGLAIAYEPDSNVLTWAPPVDADFMHFLVYRTLPAEGEPTAESTPLQSIRDVTWTDDLSDTQYPARDYQYWLAAVDSAGNSSGTIGDAAVSAVGDRELPPRNVLRANAPNPFNPRTMIAFELIASEAVDLTVFDLSGRVVHSILTGEVRAPGHHEVFWNGKDAHGRQVAAGIYFYRLVAGDYAETRRMTLVK